MSDIFFRFLATDGIDVDLQAELFDSVVVQGGERYDLHLIPTEEAKQFDTFRIRISTLEKFDENLHPLDADLHFTDVLLLCKGAKLPTVKLMNLTEEKCRADAKCRVLNCPFEQFPLNSNQTCVNPTEFRSTDAWLNRPVDETHFLNFGGIENEEYHTINNIKMGMPTFPPFLHSGPIGEVAPECEKDCGSKRRCECFQPIKIELGHVVQLVFYNKISAPSSNAQSGMGHPVHLHGYHFRVIKVGYPKRDANGIVGDMSNDITCDHLNCTDERWAAATWNEVIPGANLAHPVSKDTIFVPFGGYAVVRFVADNPGWFVLHCHILMHEAEGMMRAVQVGNENQIPKPPKGYPNVPCHSGADHRYVGLLSILLGIFLVCA